MKTICALAFVVALLAIRAVEAADRQRARFTGTLLVELEGTPDAFAAAARALTPAPGGLADTPRVEGLFETDVPVREAALRAHTPGTRRRWVVISPAQRAGALEFRGDALANPWDTAHDVADGHLSAAYRNLRYSLPRSDAVRVVTVEPDVTYLDPGLDQEMRRRAARLREAACQRPAVPARLNASP